MSHKNHFMTLIKMKRVGKSKFIGMVAGESLTVTTENNNGNRQHHPY